ncbi:hypothetical protein CERSUDRAFT_110025 [Gelatoporia subvermispora B]|uniref:PCI domain-containing protein n=1 Tax=Ceriporiopsis subvermispora (strain B) TaxID=914234 RepID=M2PX87_CERS8|nr:hypothetical protein CERSUDRAFT_110025 [Gelatoporia subvermispora B]
MELGQNAVTKLEPFLLMSKSAKGAAAAKLIQDATSAPGVFVFGELLELPNIQELATHEQYSQFYSSLQLFAYKTYQDYLQHKGSLPPLNDSQVTKLKQLSLVSLASEKRILPYSLLLQAIEMPNIRELEDLIIDAIYSDIIRGKLNQKEQQFEVEYTMGRDIEPEDIEKLLASLRNWASTTSAVLATLDDKLAALTSNAVTSKEAAQTYETAYQATLKEVYDKHKEAKAGVRAGQFTGRTGLTPAGERERDKQRERERLEREERERKEREKEQGDSMDVDEPPEGAKGKGRRAPLQDSNARLSQRKRTRP